MTKMNTIFPIDLNQIDPNDECCKAFELFDSGKKITQVALELKITEIQAATYKKKFQEYKKLEDQIF